MPQLVTIASRLDLQDAYLARARLAGSGIWCFLANEALMCIHSTAIAFAVGGVELRVMKDDASAAIEVLTGKECGGICEYDAFPAMKKRCPKCKHTKFMRKRSGWGSGWRTCLLLLGILVAFAGTPMGLPRDHKICKRCGHRWK